MNASLKYLIRTSKRGKREKSSFNSKPADLGKGMPSDKPLNPYVT